MKTPLLPGLLVRFLLLASLNNLLACSSVLQATRLSKSFPQQPAELVADAPSESLLFTNDALQQYSEATYGLPGSMASGYQRIFILKQSAQNSPAVGYWIVKPNN